MIHMSIEREYDIEEISMDGDIQKRGAETTWPWFTTTFIDRAGFAYNMFTTLTAYDSTSGSNPQTYAMIVDTGSSDTWMTTPYSTTNWPVGDSNTYSINYGWGAVSGIKIYSIPTVYVGSAYVNNFRIGYIPTPPSFLSTLSSSSVAGIFGLGAASLTSLGSANSWNGWCTTHAYVLNIAGARLEIGTNTTGGNQFSFYSGTNRAAFSTTANVIIGSFTVAITPQPMLIDTGSAYNVVDQAVALLINTYVKTLWPLTLLRRDGGSDNNSTEYEPTEEVKSNVVNLIRRQNPSVFSGPYPSYVKTLTTTFYRISCSSGAISMTLHSVTYSIPASNYVYKDTTGYCYSAFVGVSTLSNLFSGELSTFSILGQPFFRSPSITSISVNHDTKLINII